MSTRKKKQRKRGDKIKKVSKNDFADLKPWQIVKQRTHGMGTGERGKSATIRETSSVPVTGKVIVIVFVFFLFVFKSGN